ncbi:unnamed protein product [Eruca vesicaria subsp. sativa]|uniref:F-box domain-containing protein n=1 Tax=Eruca vesicaria subsp. sativa TaxID=29727 RepID=A0ABC8IVF8_ERUVS|nr:unnamed protein product [Eruca vesicaria subsp. sativa]
MISYEVEPTKKKKTVPEPPSSFSSLPDELTENILARVSRWKYASLSLVSKRFHSLLSSKEIYKTRSQIGAQETCVYVWLKLPDHSCVRWFSLMCKRDSSGMLVVPIPSSSTYSYPHRSHIEIVGSDIYVIGGYYKKPSSSVRIMDCQSHTWRDGPNMNVARESPHTVLLDEKIYVMGGCDIDEYYANWIEVFDVQTQSWAAFPGPGVDELCNDLRKNRVFYKVNVFQEKLYLETDDKAYNYEPKNGTWKVVRKRSNVISDHIQVSCEMGNVIYCCTNSRHFIWSASDIERREWRVIKGLEELRDHIRGLNTGEIGLVGCGGQLLAMWDPYPISRIKRRNKIWYAKISLESRRNGLEVWGNVECVDMLTFPVESYECFGCVAASV